MLQNLSDRALKERTIGAIVLVVFAVMIVPVFLDGTADEGETISEVVTLPGQNEQQKTQQTVVLERDRSEPVPATNIAAPVAAPEEAPPAPAVAVQAAVADSGKSETPPPEADAAPKDAPAMTSETGMWAVQLGSFSSKENAERLAASLREQGYLAFLSQLQTDAGQLHRVRIGPQKDRPSAEQVAEQLGKSGHKGQVVPHP